MPVEWRLKNVKRNVTGGIPAAAAAAFKPQRPSSATNSYYNICLDQWVARPVPVYQKAGAHSPAPMAATKTPPRTCPLLCTTPLTAVLDYCRSAKTDFVPAEEPTVRATPQQTVLPPRDWSISEALEKLDLADSKSLVPGPTCSTVMIAGSPYTFQIPAIDDDAYDNDLSLAAAVPVHRNMQPSAVLARGLLATHGSTERSGGFTQSARKMHFEEAYRDEQKQKADGSALRQANRRDLQSAGASASVAQRRAEEAGVPQVVDTQSPFIDISSPLQPTEGEQTAAVLKASMLAMHRNSPSPSTAAWSPLRPTTSPPKSSSRFLPSLASKISIGHQNAAAIEQLEALRSDFFAAAEDKDCTVPNAILTEFQSMALRAFESFNVKPVFLMAKRLMVPGNPLISQPVLMSSVDIARLKISPLTDVLSESGLRWWCDEELSVAGDTMKCLNRFIDKIKTGETGGRAFVGNAIREVNNLPIVLYSCDPRYVDREHRLKNDSRNWLVTSDCVLPVYIRTVCSWLSSKKQMPPDVANIKADIAAVAALVDSMMSDYRTHLVRCNYQVSRRYQNFIPVISRADKKLLEKDGWQEISVLNNTCKIRWKSITGGLILSYMDGFADCPTDKIMCLTFDADNHNKWIPFLSRTQRLFATQPYGLCFGYQVALPWPMSNRELTVYGMCTDAMKQDMKAIQMWCNNNPIAATSILGIPLPPLTPKSVDMEIPSLAFALSPLPGDKTRVQLCAVFDLKVSFLPMSVQNHLAKLMATKMFSNVQKIAKDFDRSEHKKVYDSNGKLFRDFVPKKS